MQKITVRRSLWGAFAVGTVAALVGGTLVAGAEPAWTAPQQHEATFDYTVSTQSWVVPAGVTSIQVEIRGGQGGNGGADATAGPDPSSYRGLVAGTLEVTPGQSLTIAVGQGGAKGGDQISGSSAANTPPAGGSNPLGAYRGGNGGLVATSGSSGQGGAGGAASVLRVNGQDIVAGGGGGNGGSGQYEPTRGRPADGTFVGRTDTTSSNGQTGIQPSGGTSNDGGGSGGGGGGAQGGAQGRVEFGAGTSTEWFGYGGSVGENRTTGFDGLSASYEHAAQNSGNGSIVIRWVTGTAAAPAAPQGVAGVGEVDLFWNPPAEIGQGPITDYQVQFSSDDGGTWSASQTVGSADAVLTVGGLTNGTAYVFRVAAVTPAGVGEFSPKSQPLTPYALPSKPTITGLAPQDGALSVTFDPPATGAPPTGYQYRVDGGSWVPVAGTGQPIVIPGLTNGVAVDIELRATSAMGTGAISDPASGTPRATPGAPTIVGTTAGIGVGTVGFVPGFDGGSPITGYEYRLDGGAWQPLVSGASPLELTGLGNGTSTAVQIRALNAAGAGAPSAAVSIVTPGAPGALVGASATGLDGAISASFSLGSNGGSPITRVEYSLDGGGTWVPVGTTGPITIPGLANGTAQSVQLRAVNAVGAGPASTVAATPATVPGAPAVDHIERTSGSGALEIEFTAPGNDGGSSITGYEYTTDGGATWTDAGSLTSPITISDGSDGTPLDEGTEYTVALRAVNAVGAGPASTARATFGPVPAVPASAPTITSVVSQPGALAVTFTPGDNGGATVDKYQYSIDGGSTWASTGSLSGQFVIGGLTDGTTYEVQVRAVTGAGDGASSAPAAGTPASTPAAPALNAVERGDGRLTVDLTLGGDGGSAITDLEYTLDGGTTWVSAGQASGPVTITGLYNGQSYTVQVRAVNAVGAGGGSNQLTSAPAAAPPQPALALTPGDTTVAVAATFSDDGGAPLTRIEYSIDGGSTWVGTGSLSGSFLLTGHPNGTPVEVRVRGVNAIGEGAPAVDSATPRTVPGPPTDVVTVGNTGSIEASWQAPADDGGSPITGYTAYAYASVDSTTPLASCTSAGPEACTITGLANGTTYFVAVAATNAAGTGPESTRRPSAMPLQRPAAPNLTAVAPGDQRLTLTFTAGAAGDRPIQRYEYSIDGGSTWLPLGTSSPATASGLTNGTLYNAQVRAVSEAGPGAASNVRSGTPFGYPFAPTNIVATPGVGSATVTWDHADLSGNTLQRYAVTLFSAASGGTILGGGTQFTTGTSLTFTGLANGTTYWVSIQTETSSGASATPTLYSERSDPRVPVTPRLAGTAPTFGPITSTVDGYTVTISNYDAAATYTLDESALPAGASASRTGNTITVTGLAPSASGTVGVTATRSDRLPASAPVTGAALNAALVPTFGTPTRTADGYTVQITNYDGAFSWGATPLTGSATVSASGLVTVTGVAPGSATTVTVLTSRSGYAPGSAATSGTALSAALVPDLGASTRTADGYTFQIENYDPDFSWGVTPSAGTASIDASGLVTVTGLALGASATATVSTSRAGYAPGSAAASGTALEAGVAPTFGTPTRTIDGFTVQIANYDAAATYTLDDSALPAGASASRTGDTITVTGLAAGASATVGVEVSKTGFTEADAGVTGAALDAALVPTFGTSTRTADGYTVQITNYDGTFAWAATPVDGSATVSASGLVTVTGLAPGASTSVAVSTTRTGYVSGHASAPGTALETGIAPTFGTPTRTADGYTVQIANYDPAVTYTLDDSALPAGASASRTGDTITVTGLAAGASGTVGVTASHPDRTEASAPVAGTALNAALVPTFGTPTRTADGYTVQITNYDGAFSWATTPLTGSATVSASGLVTVTGLAPGASTSVTVSTTRTDYVPGSSDVAGTALETGVAPTFGAPTRTADGYTVQIDNFDPLAVYTFSAPPGASAAVDGSGLVTVTGVAPADSATVGVTVSKTGFTDAQAPVTGTALETGIAPTFGPVTRTADGYTVEITNFDPTAVYLPDAPAGVTAIMVGSTLLVSGLAPEQSATVDLRVQRPGSTEAAAPVAGAAQKAGSAPRLSAPRPTPDGFEVTIIDYDPALGYALSVSAGTATRDGALITVRGLRPGQQAVLTVTSSNAGTVANTQAVAGAAALAPGVIAQTGAPGTLPLAALAALLMIAGAALLRRRREA